MVNLIRSLFGEPEEPEDAKWFEQADEIKRQFDIINSGVQSAVMSGLVKAQLAALEKASKEMPGLLRRLEALPPPKSKRRQESFAYFIEALGGYLLGCRYYKKGLENSDQRAVAHAVGHIKEAIDLMKKAENILKR